MPGTAAALSRGAPWRTSGRSSRSGSAPLSLSLVGVLPTETLQEYLKVVMALEYEEKPPYDSLRSGLRTQLQDLLVSAYDPIDLQMAP